MSQSARTPESLLPRSDSRNPASTCRGITVNGKPCRRAIASSIQSAHAKNAFVSRLKGLGQQVDQSGFYCWQHKNQTATAIDASKERKQELIATLAGKTSIDSLVDRLEILDVNDGQLGASSHKNRPNDLRRGPNGSSEREKSRSNQRGSSFCCFDYVDDTDYLPATKRVTNLAPGYASYEKRVASRPSTPSKRPVFVRDPRARVAPVVQQRPTPMTPQRWSQSLQQSTPRSSDRLPYRSSSATAPPSTPKRPSLPNTPRSDSLQTRLLMSLIPGHLSPQTTALLLTELSKPISHADEDGYIYIFWMTPEKSSPEAVPPRREIALNLLPTADRPHDTRRTSDALRAAKSINPRSKGTGTIRLKIGRTSNVHRRLAEWSKQCAHNLTLIRYYPYTNSSSTSSPGRSPVGTPNSGNSQVDARRVPHVHRVERLIHIELADQRVKGEGPCGHCNKEHREWFEITATRDALKLVDDCVRRWVAWGERGR